jgi:unsaturated rhamnogalacturonyl hydrolase
VTEAVLTVDFLYEEGPHGPFPPVVRNVVLENIRAKAAPRVLFIAGFPGATIDGIRIANSTITGVTAPEVVSNAGRVELDHVDIIPAQPPHSLSSRVKE